ncbi:MAG: MFS transporter [Actinomycetota bacterium]
MKSPEHEQESVRPLLSRGPFRRLLIGQAVSSLGDWVGTFALIAAALDLTGEPLAVGGVLVLRLVPPVFAAPLGGVLADRMDRRAIMVGANLIMAGLIALVPFVNLAGLYIIAFVSESFALLFLPARDATVPDLVPRHSLSQANGLILGFSYGAIPIGAALFSGLRLASRHVPSWIPFADALADKPLIIPFLFDTVSFLFAALMIAGISIPRRSSVAAAETHLFRGVTEAFRYGLSQPGIRALSVGVAVSMFGGGVLFALGIGYVRETLGGGDVEFGFLASLWGMGMALGIGAVRLLVRRGEGYVFQSAVAACGGILIGMAFLTFTWLAFLAALAFGIAFSVALILAVTLVQEMSSETMRGRLLGGAHMLFRVSLAAGALGVGGAASAVGDIGGFDGNQFGLLLGGGIILLGSVAAKGVVQHVPTGPSTSPDDPPAPGPT